MPSGLHRTYGAHHLHFITCSCYRRLPFLATAGSRDCFLSTLEQTCQRYRFVVVGLVVMPKHIHLLLTEPEIGNRSTVMQVLKEPTAHTLLPSAGGGIRASAIVWRRTTAGCPTLAFLARMGIRNAYPEGFTADSPGSQSPNRPEKDSRSHPRKQSSPPGDSISVPQLCCCRQ
jgi:REP element-mobilizing transposase RayT